MRLNYDGSANIGPPSVESAARKRLAKTGYGSLGSVRCHFRDGTITLHGSVPSYFHKQLAQESLRNAPHVTQVVNHIEVVPR